MKTQHLALALLFAAAVVLHGYFARPTIVIAVGGDGYDEDDEAGDDEDEVDPEQDFEIALLRDVFGLKRWTNIAMLGDAGVRDELFDVLAKWGEGKE